MYMYILYIESSKSLFSLWNPAFHLFLASGKFSFFISNDYEGKKMNIRHNKTPRIWVILPFCLWQNHKVNQDRIRGLTGIENYRNSWPVFRELMKQGISQSYGNIMILGALRDSAISSPCPSPPQKFSCLLVACVQGEFRYNTDMNLDQASVKKAV